MKAKRGKQENDFIEQAQNGQFLGFFIKGMNFTVR